MIRIIKHEGRLTEQLQAERKNTQLQKEHGIYARLATTVDHIFNLPTIMYPASLTNDILAVDLNWTKWNLTKHFSAFLVEQPDLLS